MKKFSLLLLLSLFWASPAHVSAMMEADKVEKRKSEESPEKEVQQYSKEQEVRALIEECNIRGNPSFSPTGVIQETINVSSKEVSSSQEKTPFASENFEQSEKEDLSDLGILEKSLQEAQGVVTYLAEKTLSEKELNNLHQEWTERSRRYQQASAELQEANSNAGLIKQQLNEPRLKKLGELVKVSRAAVDELEQSLKNLTQNDTTFIEENLLSANREKSPANQSSLTLEHFQEALKTHSNGKRFVINNEGVIVAQEPHPTNLEVNRDQNIMITKQLKAILALEYPELNSENLLPSSSNVINHDSSLSVKKLRTILRRCEEIDALYFQRSFNISRRKFIKKSPNYWNKTLFDLFKMTTPLNEWLATKKTNKFAKRLNKIITEAEESLFSLKEAREQLTKKVHNTIIKELPLINTRPPLSNKEVVNAINNRKDLLTGPTLSPWQPTVHYPFQQLIDTHFAAENHLLYWNQAKEVFSEFVREVTHERKRKKLEEVIIACEQISKEAEITKKAIEKLMLEIGSTRRMNDYASECWDSLTKPLNSVYDFIKFKGALEEIERVAEDEEINYVHSSEFKFILPEAKKYFKEKWKGFTSVKENLIVTVDSKQEVISSRKEANSFFREAIRQCEQFYNEFKKEPNLGQQIGKLLIESRKNELRNIESKAQEANKKIKDSICSADENSEIWNEEEEEDGFDAGLQEPFVLNLKPFKEILANISSRIWNKKDVEENLYAKLQKPIKAEWNKVIKEALGLIDYLGDLTTQNSRDVWMDKLLKNAGGKRGNFNLMEFYLSNCNDMERNTNYRAVSSDVANALGEKWVGLNYVATTETNGNGNCFKKLMSSDSLRCYRSPTKKYKGEESYAPTGVQANFEWRETSTEQWKGNGHLDICIKLP